MPYRLLILLCLLLLSSCAANRMVETDLYFGMSKPDGGAITDKEWNSFKENQVSNVFSEGCTIIDAYGAWRDPATRKLGAEQSHVVIYVHKKSAQLSRKIDSLRSLYKTMFKQESVLRVDKKVTFNF